MTEPGLICCFNDKPGENHSAFFITLQPIPVEVGFHKRYQVLGRVLKGLDFLVSMSNKYGFDQNGKPQFPVTVHECKELTQWIKIDVNGNSFGWNDYIKHGAGLGGITSPEREFDKAWNDLIFTHRVDYVEAATQEFFDALPTDELPKDHPFMKDRDKFLLSRLPTKE